LQNRIEFKRSVLSGDLLLKVWVSVALTGFWSVRVTKKSEAVSELNVLKLKAKSGLDSAG
jgi:hypothetical protein